VTRFYDGKLVVKQACDATSITYIYVFIRPFKYRKYKTYLMEKDGDEKSGCSLFAAEK